MLMGLKQAYWDKRRALAMWHKALAGPEAAFRKVVLEDHLLRGKTRLQPVRGETQARAAAAAGWLMRAQDASPDGGVSYGYFPAGETGGWEVSYPETTGYIMTTMIAFARAMAAEAERPALVERARRMATWEADIQMANGAVQGGKLTAADRRKAVAFNTGMVLDGFVSVLEEGGDPRIEAAAGRAAGFLVNDLNPAGLFTTNGPFVSADAIKTYNVLCAWAMYRFGKLVGDPACQSAALRSVEAAIGLMTANGWLRENCLTDSLHPLTHTIGYSLQGMLEVGALAGREDFIAAARRGYDPIVPLIEDSGFLAGRLGADWRPWVRWSCLTGSAQLAIVGFRLGEIVGDRRYRDAADRLVDWLKVAQRLATGSPGIDGAIAGSFPVFGGYMTAGYPNWATKYLLDALLLQRRLGSSPG